MEMRNLRNRMVTPSRCCHVLGELFSECCLTVFSISHTNTWYNTVPFHHYRAATVAAMLSLFIAVNFVCFILLVLYISLVSYFFFFLFIIGLALGPEWLISFHPMFLTCVEITIKIPGSLLESLNVKESNIIRDFSICHQCERKLLHLHRKHFILFRQITYN